MGLSCFKVSDVHSLAMNVDWASCTLDRPCMFQARAYERGKIICQPHDQLQHDDNHTDIEQDRPDCNLHQQAKPLARSILAEQDHKQGLKLVLNCL